MTGKFRQSAYNTLVLLRRRFDKWTREMQLLLKEFFVDQLPSESLQNLPSPYIFWSGWLVYLSITALFVSLFITVFNNARSERFLSLSSDGMDCENVYRDFDGEYLLDTSGHWEGAEKFRYTDAVYRLTINSFSGSSSDFESLMHKAFMSMERIGAAAVHNNLAINLIMWMTFQATALYGGSTQIVSLAGSPQIIFNNKQLAGNLNNRDGRCDVIPTVHYYRSDSLIEFQWDYTRYTSSSACMGILTPTQAAYDPVIEEDTFKLTINVEAIATAMGVNLGIIPSDELQKIAKSEFSYQYKGQHFQLAKYYYNRFPGMDSMICYETPSTQEDVAPVFMCAIDIGGNGLVGFPLFDHAGYSATTPEPCVCDEGAVHSESFQNNCNAFKLMGGLLFFNNDEGGSLDSFFEFLFFSNKTVDEIATQSYNATYDTAHKSNIYRSDSLWRQAAFEFCSVAEVSNSKCGILGFYSGTLGRFDITEYYYQIPWGACNDSFTLPAEVKQNILATPPTTFKEIYMECRNSLWDVINNTLGIVMGNMGLYIPFIVLVTWSLISIYTKWNNLSVDQTYSSKEKDEILQYFAFNMLLARDGHYPSPPDQQHNSGVGRGEGSLLLALKDELAVNVGICRFLGSGGTSEKQQNDNRGSSDKNDVNNSCSDQDGDGVEMGNIHSSTSPRNIFVNSETDARVTSTDFIENPLFVSAKNKSK